MTATMRCCLRVPVRPVSVESNIALLPVARAQPVCGRGGLEFVSESGRQTNVTPPSGCIAVAGHRDGAHGPGEGAGPGRCEADARRTSPAVGRQGEHAWCLHAHYVHIERLEHVLINHQLFCSVTSCSALCMCPAYGSCLNPGCMTPLTIIMYAVQLSG